MHAVYFLAGQSAASPSALHSSQILEELNSSLFLSSDFKMNGQFGFGHAMIHYSITVYESDGVISTALRS